MYSYVDLSCTCPGASEAGAVGGGGRGTSTFNDCGDSDDGDDKDDDGEKNGLMGWTLVQTPVTCPSQAKTQTQEMPPESSCTNRRSSSGSSSSGLVSSLCRYMLGHH